MRNATQRIDDTHTHASVIGTSAVKLTDNDIFEDGRRGAEARCTIRCEVVAFPAFPAFEAPLSRRHSRGIIENTARHALGKSPMIHELRTGDCRGTAFAEVTFPQKVVAALSITACASFAVALSLFL